MDNKEALIGEGEKKEATIVVGAKKSILVYQVVGIIIFLIVAVIASFVLDSAFINKEKVQEIVNEETKLEEIQSQEINIDKEKSNDFITNFNFVLQNTFNDTGHLVPDVMRNSKNLVDDEVTMFRMVYFIIDKFDDTEEKLYDVNINGEKETGYFAVKYDYYKNFYYELIGKKFNEEVLTKVTDEFVQRGDYLFYVLPDEYKGNYQLVSESFIEKDNKYYFVTVINELDENNQVILSYKMKFDLEIINNKYVLSSVIFY